MYSHKGVFRARGSLRINREQFTLYEDESFAIPDIHKGYYPREMMWHWGTGAGWHAGKLIGFNVTTNQALEPERYHENAVWVDGKVQRLPPVQFEMQLEGERGGTARVRDAYGYVDLTFEGSIARKVDMNVLIARSRYRGPYGVWRGSLRVGDTLETVELPGMAEDMYIRA